MRKAIKQGMIKARLKLAKISLLKYRWYKEIARSAKAPPNPKIKGRAAKKQKIQKKIKKRINRIRGGLLIK